MRFAIARASTLTPSKVAQPSSLDGRGEGEYSVKAGGEGRVVEAHRIWRGRRSSGGGREHRFQLRRFGISAAAKYLEPCRGELGTVSDISLLCRSSLSNARSFVRSHGGSRGLRFSLFSLMDLGLSISRPFFQASSKGTGFRE
jgi:hypothetical protein